jgi:hypothetical protein
VTFYSAPFTFDYVASQILLDGGAVNITCSALYTAIKLAQMDIEGITYPRIAVGSGLSVLGPGVQVGLTLELLGNWQLKFPAGNYTATVGGGNLIGGPGADPIAYSAGVQNVLIQSASSTVVSSDASAIAAATVAALNATTIPVNIDKVRGQSLVGNGTSTPWGPA